MRDKILFKGEDLGIKKKKRPLDQKKRWQMMDWSPHGTPHLERYEGISTQDCHMGVFVSTICKWLVILSFALFNLLS